MRVDSDFDLYNSGGGLVIIFLDFWVFLLYVICIMYFFFGVGKIIRILK